ncbi:MAG: M20/M25/M40 family metallo-hydrolase [Longimicrobiales bacterium]
MRTRNRLLGLAFAIFMTSPLSAQTFPSEDPVLRRIWQLGMEESRAPGLAQVLMDSIGPRLTGTPGQKAAHDWAVKMYESWGITARNEQYGTWTGWRRGITHVDLIAPRVRSLEGMMMAWSGGTGARPVEGDVVLLPEPASSDAFQAWLPGVRGKFVALDFAQPTCRPDRQWEEFGAPATQGDGTSSFDRMSTARGEADEAWDARVAAIGLSTGDLRLRLEEAGAAGVLHSRWSQDYGVNKIFGTNTRRIPSIDLSCEDYGLVVRLARNNQGPRIRVTAESEFLPDAPTFNTIAEIKGSELPNEYVMLSAHFDSWDGSSGATDNGTGTITMMEAMRILKLAYPNPRRTILVGHWSGEEQGLNGSRAFAHDHPEIVEGLQALFNQDNGTGRVVRISMQGLTGAAAHFGTWLSKIPQQITDFITLQIPGSPGGGGSDYASFICAGAPAFSLSALNWGYGTYTWHTNRDTYDKIVMDDLKNNATLTAMLAYLASEDPERVARDRRVLASGRGGGPATWPQCRDGARTPPTN